MSDSAGRRNTSTNATTQRLTVKPRAIRTAFSLEFSIPRPAILAFLAFPRLLSIFLVLAHRRSSARIIRCRKLRREQWSEVWSLSRKWLVLMIISSSSIPVN